LIVSGVAISEDLNYTSNLALRARCCNFSSRFCWPGCPRRRLQARAPKP